jgi:hypothetical protein
MKYCVTLFSFMSFISFAQTIANTYHHFSKSGGCKREITFSKAEKINLGKMTENL